MNVEIKNFDNAFLKCKTFTLIQLFSSILTFVKKFNFFFDIHDYAIIWRNLWKKHKRNYQKMIFKIIINKKKIDENWVKEFRFSISNFARIASTSTWIKSNFFRIFFQKNQSNIFFSWNKHVNAKYKKYIVTKLKNDKKTKKSKLWNVDIIQKFRVFDISCWTQIINFNNYVKIQIRTHFFEYWRIFFWLCVHFLC